MDANSVLRFLFESRHWVISEPFPPICTKCHGSGKCPECFGSGVNVHLNQDEPNNTKCSGSGVCPECGGTGLFEKLPAVDG
jgi:DnaJ-class molecular chaperone